MLFGGFAGVALTLAAVGIHGLLSLVVRRRTPQLAVRLALGASTAELFSTVIRDGVRLALLGVAVGSVASLGLARAMDSLLYGVPGLDLPTLGVVGVTLLVAATLACLLPARRAARTNPILALKEL